MDDLKEMKAKEQQPENTTAPAPPAAMPAGTQERNSEMKPAPADKPAAEATVEAE